jgi:hypothetical protein
MPAFRVGDPGPNPGRSTKLFLMWFYMRFFGVTVSLLHVSVELAVCMEGFTAYFADQRSRHHPIGGFFRHRRGFGQSFSFHRRHFRIKRVSLPLKYMWLQGEVTKKIRKKRVRLTGVVFRSWDRRWRLVERVHRSWGRTLLLVRVVPLLAVAVVEHNQKAVDRMFVQEVSLR